ncbi:MAG TPA: multicopper oxidase domain-containing protein [Burkholderiales bacterium]|nr:multicopper oxidase domain-containing protein [Burkholderiales bacterium]
MNAPVEYFPTESAGLPQASAPQSRRLEDGDRFDLTIAPVAKRIGDASVRMLAYNGSIPGPTIRVRQGSELVVHATNLGDLEATVHWHGLRLANRYDGTAETQQPIPVGGSFTYRLQFPDPGVYWYHPHIREDYNQEMGLYGSIVVEPAAADYWPPAHRELTMTLDDILIEQGTLAPFRRSETTHTAMGRFGNVLLVNGEPESSFTARRGEVVRFYLTDTANTRVFNVAVRGARMKLVGGDSGRYEREQFVESVLIAPSERVVVDVLFDEPGEAVIEHRTPHRTYVLARIRVANERTTRSLAAEFGTLRVDPELRQERERIASFLDAEPRKTLTFVAEMSMGTPQLAAGATLEYFCPMHPDVIRDAPGKCPSCAMKLLPREAGTAKPDAHAHAGAAHPHGEPKGHFPSGIEWEDDMAEINRITTRANTRWKLIEPATGAQGAAIDWRFRVGERVKIRLVNTMDSDHPMHHPFHVHGAGRFLILARDGVVEPNLVWKDTVLIPTGQTVDILLEVTNPGRWMAHCHIAEHHESGMMFSFYVDA